MERAFRSLSIERVHELASRSTSCEQLDLQSSGVRVGHDCAVAKFSVFDRGSELRCTQMTPLYAKQTASLLIRARIQHQHLKIEFETKYVQLIRRS